MVSRSSSHSVGAVISDPSSSHSSPRSIRTMQSASSSIPSSIPCPQPLASSSFYYLQKNRKHSIVLSEDCRVRNKIRRLSCPWTSANCNKLQSLNGKKNRSSLRVNDIDNKNAPPFQTDVFLTSMMQDLSPGVSVYSDSFDRTRNASEKVSLSGSAISHDPFRLRRASYESIYRTPSFLEEEKTSLRRKYERVNSAGSISMNSTPIHKKESLTTKQSAQNPTTFDALENRNNGRLSDASWLTPEFINHQSIGLQSDRISTNRKSTDFTAVLSAEVEIDNNNNNNNRQDHKHHCRQKTRHADSVTASCKSLGCRGAAVSTIETPQLEMPGFGATTRRMLNLNEDMSKTVLGAPNRLRRWKALAALPPAATEEWFIDKLSQLEEHPMQVLSFLGEHVQRALRVKTYTEALSEGYLGLTLCALIREGSQCSQTLAPTLCRLPQPAEQRTLLPIWVFAVLYSPCKLVPKLLTEPEICSHSKFARSYFLMRLRTEIIELLKFVVEHLSDRTKLSFNRHTSWSPTLTSPVMTPTLERPSNHSTNNASIGQEDSGATNSRVSRGGFGCSYCRIMRTTQVEVDENNESSTGDFRYGPIPSTHYLTSSFLSPQLNIEGVHHIWDNGTIIQQNNDSENLVPTQNNSQSSSKNESQFFFNQTHELTSILNMINSVYHYDCSRISCKEHILSYGDSFKEKISKLIADLEAIIACFRAYGVKTVDSSCRQKILNVFLMQFNTSIQLYRKIEVHVGKLRNLYTARVAKSTLQRLSHAWKYEGALEYLQTISEEGYHELGDASVDTDIYQSYINYVELKSDREAVIRENCKTRRDLRLNNQNDITDIKTGTSSDNLIWIWRSTIVDTVWEYIGGKVDQITGDVIAPAELK